MAGTWNVSLTAGPARMSMLLSALLYVDFLSLLISVGLAGTPPWAVSAPDFALGSWAWVQTKGN